jgi:hypothetical protein
MDTHAIQQAGGGVTHHFPHTYDNRRNRLKLVFRKQDKIVWDNLLKGRMGRQWIEYVKHHIQNKDIKVQAKEGAPKMILTLWDHMLRLWQYRNEALHEDNSHRVAPFKVEALDQEIERLATRHNDLQSKLHNFQE